MPPGNRLEALKGDRKGQHSIRRLSTTTEAIVNPKVGGFGENGKKEEDCSSTQRCTPGEILREEFMVPMGITSYRLAKDLRLTAPRVNDIVRKRRAISADTALRLARYFGTSAQLWLNLQARYDLLLATANGKEISKIKPRGKEAAA